jgi:hypothetical protein
MPLGEIPHRISERTRRAADNRSSTARALHELPEQVRGKAPPCFPVDRSRLSEIPAHWRESLAADVDALLRHDVTLLGARFPSRTCWGFDPVMGSEWPQDPVWSIDLRGDGCDVKLACELLRLQVQQVLALGAAVLGRRDARQAVIEDLRSYLSWEAPYRGIPWVAGIECASRVASLLNIAGVLGSEAVPSDIRARWWSSLQAHGVWLDRYPSLHSSSNNHRVAELSASLALAVLAPELGRASTAGDYAAHLERVACRQFHPDGTGSEQSPTYQAYTMEWLLWARRLADEAGLTFEVDALLEGGAGFLRSLMDVESKLPRIGDDDEGVVMRQSIGPENLPASVCGAVAGMLGQPQLAPPHWEGDLRAGVLGAPLTKGEAPSPRSKIFKQGGYTVLRWQTPMDEALLVFDHGRLGFPGTAGHGHADALAVWLHVGAQPVLIDSGTYRYNGAPAWRSWMRATGAHNTLQVTGHEQSEIRGPFNWGRRAVAEHVEADLGNRRVVGLHDGYLSSAGLVHLRQVRVPQDDVVEIEDLLIGKGRRHVAVSWHFAPELGLEQLDETRLLVTRGGQPLLSIELCEGGLGARVLRGRSSPGRGFVSPSYNVLVVSSCLVWEGTIELPARLRHRFVL